MRVLHPERSAHRYRELLPMRGSVVEVSLLVGFIGELMQVACPQGAEDE